MKLGTWLVIGAALSFALGGCDSEKQTQQLAVVEKTPAEPDFDDPHGDREKPGVWRTDGIAIVQYGRGEPNDEGRLFQIYFSEPVALANDVALRDVWEAQWGDQMRKDDQCPLIIEPEMPLQYTWETDQLCVVEVAKAATPDSVYSFRLRDGLKTAAGDELRSDIVARYRSRPFQINWLEVHDQYSGDGLSRFPMATMEFNHPIDAQTIADKVYFQTRDGRTRFPVEVMLRPWDDAQALTEFTVKARDGLAGGEEVDLIVERLASNELGKKMRHLRVEPMGVTKQPFVQWVLAANRPNEAPEIQVRFSEKLQPSSLDASAVRVEPAVADLSLVPIDDDLFLRGSFDPKLRYTVTVTEAVTARSGFGVAEQETWGATFARKRPALSFRGESVQFGERASGLKVPLVQTNTGAVRWSLRPVAAENFLTVREALVGLRNFPLNTVGVETMAAHLPADIVALAGADVASGEFPATPESEQQRSIEVAAAALPANPAYLLQVEAMAVDAEGASVKVGNARLISLGDHAVVLKKGPDQSELRVWRNKGGGDPAGNERVAVFDVAGNLAHSGVTDAEGHFNFPSEEMAYAVVGSENSNGVTLRWLAGGGAFPSGTDFVAESGEAQVEAFTDRGLYRPGEKAYIKAIGRMRGRNGELTLPETATVGWQIEESRSGNVVASGEAQISPDGGWSLEWQVPEHQATGEHYYTDDLGGRVTFGVEEFRRPLFSVLAQSEDTIGAEARLVVSSEYFYLEPNAHAEVEWTAEWTVDDQARDFDYDSEVSNSMDLINVWDQYYHDYYPFESFPGSDDENDSGGGGMDGGGPRFSLIDQFSRDSPGQGFTYQMVSQIAKAGGEIRWDDSKVYSSAQASGTVRLDENGRAEIVCPSPFPADARLRRAGVYWSVKVTSIEGQKFDSAAQSHVQFAPEILAARLVPGGGDRVGVEVMALDPWDEQVRDVAVQAAVYRVDYRTTLEKTGDHVVRYNNEPVFEEIWSGTLPTPIDHTVEVPRGGRYVIIAKAAENERVPQVSASVLVDGKVGEAIAVAVDDLHSVRISTMAEEYKVGDMASFEIESSFAGVGWLTVETDRILHSEAVALERNAMTLTLPVRAEYFPNAEVTLYALRPAAEDGATPAAEAFGHCTLRVEDANRRLTVEPAMARQFFEPRERVEGKVLVSIDGKPLANAEVTLFAVDRAIQDLALWQAPDLGEEFHRKRPYAVETFRGFGGLGGIAGADSFFQKGFIVGGGGGKIGGQLTRQNAQPIAYWNADLRTDAEGKVSFDFVAPDTLTSYRVSAVANSGVDRFGNGSAEFTVKKKLWINPALPRFLREGDRFELTGSVNQTARPEDRVRVTCEIGDALSLASPAELVFTVKNGAAVLANFKGEVAEGKEGSEAEVVLSAVSEADPSLSDSIRVTLPVLGRGIDRRAVFSQRVETGAVTAGELPPQDWQARDGEFEVYLSGTENLPRYLGIPQIMRYPHGCLEQKSSKLLSYALFDDLFDNLPEKLSGTGDYQRRLGEQLRLIESAATPTNGWESEFGGTVRGVPYWAGSEEINPFATVQTAWALLEARIAGIGVDDEVLQSMLAGVRTIAENRTSKRVSRITRAYGLMVMARFDEIGPEARVGLVENEESWQTVRESLLAAAVEIHRRRESLGDDGTAFLALAMHGFGELAEEKQTLMEELGRAPKREAFDPATFSSATRDEALRLAARIRVKDAAMTADEENEAKVALQKLMAGSADLSNQENLWLLYVMRALENRGAATAADLRQRAFTLMPASFSPNGATAMWADLPLSELGSTKMGFADGAALPLSAVMIARYQDRGDGEGELPPSGLKLSRRLSILGKPGVGIEALSIGDDVLITYTVETDRPHSFVALVDHLPACLETVNPNLPQVGKFFKLPDDVAENSLALSHSELLDDRTQLYFDELPVGVGHFTVLARVTSAGQFHWPPGQVTTMYDSRFEATSTGEEVVASAER